MSRPKFKAKCICPYNGYEDVMEKNQVYEITDIQDGIFAGDYYVIGVGSNNKQFTCHLYRFDITKKFANAYVLEHHLDWRKKAKFPSKTYEEPS